MLKRYLIGALLSAALLPLEGAAQTEPEAPPKEADRGGKASKKRTTKKRAGDEGKKKSKKKRRKGKKGKEDKGAKKPAPKPKPEAKAPKEGPSLDLERPSLMERTASQRGMTGWDQAWSADPGAPKTFRLRVGFETSSADDFPVEGSSNDFTALRFSLAWTPTELVETGLSISSTSNINDKGRPELLQTQGDTDLHIKVGRFLTKHFAAGAGATLSMLSGMGTGGFETFNFTLRALMTLDLHRTGRMPLRMFLDTGYTFENSDSVYGDREEPPSLIDEFGLNTARYDRLATHLGFEVPASHWAVPYAEYTLTLPFLVELTHRSEDSNEFEFGSLPHTLAMGLRSFPMPELAIEAALRFGFGDQFYTGVPATPPWLGMLALTYTLDPRPEVIVKEVKPETPPPPPRVEVAGKVLDAKGAPLANAQVVYPGVSAQLTDEMGRFEGYEFEPGPMILQIKAEGHKPARVDLVLVKGQAPQIKVQLELDPTKAEARVEVYVSDEKGRPIEAQIALAGAEGSHTPVKPYRGAHKPGEHTLVVSAKGYETVEKPVALKGGASHPFRIQLKKGKRQARALVSLKGRTLRFRRAVAFSKGSTTLSGGAKRVLNDLAALLKANPQITKIRVGAHTDNRGGRIKNLNLSRRQAEAVKSYLTSRGISARRIQAKGYGPDKPRAPNLTKRGREKNRRVEFVIVGMK